MRLFYKNEGVISVFLVLILVPVLTITCLFVDASRTMLAKSVVSSAGDLALNSMMTQYDATLNEFYGLLASAQSIDEFESTVKTYLKNSMESKGVANNEIQKIINQAGEAMGMHKSENISDLLNIVVDEKDITAKTIGNSGLNNPAVVKTQIVNFMKYRAPIDGVSELLGHFKKVSEETENKTEEAEIIEAKQEAAEAEGELMASLKELYEQCRKYTKKVKTLDSSAQNEEKAFQSLLTYCKSCKNKYLDIHVFVVCNLLYASEMNSGVKEFSPGKVTKYDKTKYSPSKKATEQNIRDVICGLQNAAAMFYEWEAKVKELIEALDNSTSKKSEIQRYITYGKKIKNTYKEFIQAANDVSRYRELLSQAMNNTNVDVEATGKELTIECKNGDHYTQKGSYKEIAANMEVLYKKIWEHELKSSPYTKMRNNQKRYAVSSKKINDLINQEKRKMNSLLEQISNRLKSYQNILKEVEKCIDDQISKLGTISNQRKQFDTTQEKWKNRAEAAKNKGIKLGENEIKTMTDTSQEEGALIQKIKDNVTDTNIAQMKSRLNALKKKITQLRKAIGTMKYGGTSIKSINQVNTVISKLKKSGLISKEQVENGNEDTLTNKAKNIFGQFYDGFSQGETNWLTSDDTAPVLSNPKDGKKTKLYRFMKEHFKDYDEEDYNKNEKEYKEHEKRKDKTIDNAKDNNKEIEALADIFKNTSKEVKDSKGANSLPSELWSKNNALGSIGAREDSKEDKKNLTVTDASKSLNSIFGVAGNAIKSAGVAIRDDLYAIDYIRNMFTCDTTVKEGLYDLAAAKNKNVSTLAKAIKAEKEVTADYNSVAITNTYNHSMTNQLICNKNNVCMGNEIEYILYGGKNKSNQAKAWGTIFAIRFAFNAIYGFTNLYRPKADNTDALLLQSIATAISIATCGVVPVSLVKIALILAVVVAESLSDITYMENGMPVELIKSKDTWHISVQSILDGGDVTANENHIKKGLGSLAFRYSDYLNFFLLVSMIGEHEYTIYSRVADVIQVNMQTVSKDFAMEKAKTWFTVSAKVQVKPLMLQLPINTSYLSQENISPDFSNWGKLTYQMSNGYY